MVLGGRSPGRGKCPGASDPPFGVALGYPPGQKRCEGRHRAGEPAAPQRHSRGVGRSTAGAGVTELVRYRAKLTALRTSAKAQVHAVMAKLGILPPMSDMFGPGGQRLLDEMDFPGPYGLRVESLRDLLEIYGREIALVEREIARWLKADPGYRAIQALHGIGPITAAILVAEIGDVHRFPTARHLCSWAGMTPKLSESDTTSRSGRITKQG